MTRENAAMLRSEDHGREIRDDLQAIRRDLAAIRKRIRALPSHIGFALVVCAASGSVAFALRFFG